MFNLHHMHCLPDSKEFYEKRIALFSDFHSKLPAKNEFVKYVEEDGKKSLQVTMEAKQIFGLSSNDGAYQLKILTKDKPVICKAESIRMVFDVILMNKELVDFLLEANQSSYHHNGKHENGILIDVPGGCYREMGEEFWSTISQIRKWIYGFETKRKYGIWMDTE